MNGRRTAAILAALAGLSAATFVAALFLVDRDPAPAPAPSPMPAPRKADPALPVPPAATAPPGSPAAAAAARLAKPAETPASTAEGEPWARLRFLDSTNERVLTEDDGVYMTRYVAGMPSHWRQRLVAREEGTFDLLLDGQTATASEQEMRYAVFAFGYQARLGLGRNDLVQRNSLLLDPAIPTVRGVVIAGPGVEVGKAEWNLEDAPDPERGEAGNAFNLPLEPGVSKGLRTTGLGALALYDVGKGRFRLVGHIQQSDGCIARAQAEFVKGEGTVDIGTIEARMLVSIRARVIAADGSGVLDRSLSVVPVGQGAQEIGSEEPDAQGWVTFPFLDPDRDYRVHSRALRVEEVVRTPGDGRRVATVELKHDLQGVVCRIRFTVKGEAPAKWGSMFEGPALDPGAWDGSGLLQQEMAPGEYLFGFEAQPSGLTSMKRFVAKFTVPDRRDWDTTVDLKEDL